MIAKEKVKPDFRHADKDGGYVFEESTTRFWALDAQGRLLGETASANAGE